MADVNISKYTTQVVRDGSKPASPGYIVSEGQDPVNPPGTNNYVPYSGATDDVQLGEFGLETGYVKLDTTPTNTPADQGTIYWDDAKSTAALIMNGTLQHIGQDIFFYVKNSTGSSIPKGTAVRFNGTDGASGHLLIAPFLANGTYPSSYFVGVTAETIANGSFGQVMHFGELSGINTSGYTAGALLYASTTVAGAFQTTAPVAPNNIVLIAAAINSTNNGTILVRPTYGSNINQDEGVKITSVADKDLLQYQSGNGLWENKTLAQVIGTAYVPSTRTITINGTTQDLSANRTFNVGTVTSVGLSSATSGVTIGSTPVTTSGTITIAIATASGSQNGLLSSTDWTTFNNKQNALTNPVTGTGTTNYLPKFTGSTTIGNSALLENNGNVGLGTATPLSVSNYRIFTANGTNGSGYATQVNGTLSLYLYSNSNGSTISEQRNLPLFFETNGTLRSTLDASGNLGLGVTPSTWNSAYKAIQFGTTGALFGESGDAANYFTTNTFVDSVGFKYITSDWALGYFQENGVHSWRNATSGTAGNAISFTQAMTLTSGGNLLVGTTTDAGFRFQVTGEGRFYQSATNSTAYLRVENNRSRNAALRLTTTVGDYLLGVGVGADVNQFQIYDNAAGATRLTISSTGAATFSSSVTASTGYYLKHTNTNTIAAIEQFSGTQGGGFSLFNSSGTQNVLFNAGGDSFIRGGNVGIGTTSPSSLFTVAGTSDLAFTNGTTLLRINRSGSQARIQNYDGGSVAPIALNWEGGNVLIGTTTDAGAKLQVSGNVRISNNGQTDGALVVGRNGNNNSILVVSDANNTSEAYIRGFSTSSSSSTLIIYSNGNIVNTNGSYGTISDIKYKENISDANFKLDDILNLKVRNFNLIGDTKKQIGFIAQEFEKIFPSLVESDGLNGLKMIKTSVLIPIMVKAIQEQQVIINDLKQKIS